MYPECRNIPRKRRIRIFPPGRKGYKLYFEEIRSYLALPDHASRFTKHESRITIHSFSNHAPRPTAASNPFIPLVLYVSRLLS